MNRTEFILGKSKKGTILKTDVRVKFPRHTLKRAGVDAAIFEYGKRKHPNIGFSKTTWVLVDWDDRQLLNYYTINYWK